MNLWLAMLLVNAWQATATIELKGSIPGVCAIRYEDSASGLVAAVEKRDAGGQSVVTAFTVTGHAVTAARLVTANTNSAALLKAAPPQRSEAYRAEAVLEDDDAGALLIHDLAISGGRLEIERGRGTETFELPHPLPREVVGQYLNCTGDLVIPY